MKREMRERRGGGEGKGGGRGREVKTDRQNGGERPRGKDRQTDRQYGGERLRDGKAGEREEEEVEEQGVEKGEGRERD